jgi:Mor family transcriptional regulator
VKYKNGKDIFPPQLLRQIQEYVSGRLVYIPAAEGKRAWGETSGYRRYLAERNAEIRARFGKGAGLEALAEEYYLSCETIKKIVYSKKEESAVEYQCSLTSARDFARNGRLEEWVHAYLLSDGHNKEFSDGLKQFERCFLGPVKMPLSLFQRCCGPEEGMRWRIQKEWFDRHVEELEKVIARETDMPPLIVHYLFSEKAPEGEFELNDGNHRLEAYSRMGIPEYFVIVWITEEREREQFLERYAAYFNEEHE